MSELQINESSTSTWSKLGPRATYGLAMLDLVERSPNIIVATADLGNSSGLERLRKLHPQRLIDVGIAEQNLIGVASGIAKEGFTVYASSFAPFITMRASEQLRMNLGYMELDVKAVGIGSGLSMNFLGNSHFGLEDLSVVRAIPNIQIVSPADCTEVVKVINATAISGRPTYIRLTGAPGIRNINQSDYSFEIGKNIEYFEGFDLTFLATGSMVGPAIEAAEILCKKGIKTGVVNCHTLRPFDSTHLGDLVQRTAAIITIEEHFTSGGLGTQVLEALNEMGSNFTVYRMGIPHKYDQSGSYEFLLNYYGLTSAMILEKTLKIMQTNLKI